MPVQKSLETYWIHHAYIGLLGRVYANDPEDQGSISGWVLPRTQKRVLETTLPNIQHYKVHIKGKVKESRERSSAPLHLGEVAMEKRAFGSSSTTVTNIIPPHRKDMTHGKFLSRVYQVWIQNFPSPRLIA